MPAITREMIWAAFDESVTVRNGDKTFAEADRSLQERFDFNLSSAKDYTRNLHQMLDGKRFTRTLNSEGTQIYLKRIRDELGEASLRRALQSIDQHLAYYEQLTGRPSKMLRDTASEFRTEERSTKQALADFEEDVAKAMQRSSKARLKRLAHASDQPETTKTITTTYLRNADVVAEVLHRAQKTCEHCQQSAPFIKRSNGAPYLEVHHRVPLSEGGPDTIENAIALCPNCHREAHHGEHWKTFRSL